MTHSCDIFHSPRVLVLKGSKWLCDKFTFLTMANGLKRKNESCCLAQVKTCVPDNVVLFLFSLSLLSTPSSSSSSSQ